MFASILMVGCKCKKVKADIQYWQKVDFKIEGENNFNGNYLTYKLNEKLFFEQFAKDSVLLPDLQGNLNLFSVQENQTISPELAAKFPELKTYQGVQKNNTLCQSRITFQNFQPDITVLCNNQTYYIKKVTQDKTSFYVVFDKKDTKNTLSE